MDLLKLLYDKLSQYDIFVNIIPGTILSICISNISRFNLLISENIFILAILFYFVGTINNRVGSLLVEPILKIFVEFAEYDKYLKASKLDPKIPVLNQDNNTYRSYISVFLISLCAYFLDVVIDLWDLSDQACLAILAIVLILLFSCSYYKQTRYIKKRIEHVLHNEPSCELDSAAQHKSKDDL